MSSIIAIGITVLAFLLIVFWGILRARRTTRSDYQQEPPQQTPPAPSPAPTTMTPRSWAWLWWLVVIAALVVGGWWGMKNIPPAPPGPRLQTRQIPPQSRIFPAKFQNIQYFVCEINLFNFIDSKNIRKFDNMIYIEKGGYVSYKFEVRELDNLMSYFLLFTFYPDKIIEAGDRHEVAIFEVNGRERKTELGFISSIQTLRAEQGNWSLTSYNDAHYKLRIGENDLKIKAVSCPWVIKGPIKIVFRR
jgi:hypothetical protein